VENFPGRLSHLWASLPVYLLVNWSEDHQLAGFPEQVGLLELPGHLAQWRGLGTQVVVGSIRQLLVRVLE
jgi:hypothetical protein